MSPMTTYETLRHAADSWGLVAMIGIFLALIAWPLRPSARDSNRRAAETILKDDCDGE